jgi:hypothetical protein
MIRDRTGDDTTVCRARSKRGEMVEGDQAIVCCDRMLDGTGTRTLLEAAGHTHLSLAGDGRSYAEMVMDPYESMVLAGVRSQRRRLAAGVTPVRDH